MAYSLSLTAHHPHRRLRLFTVCGPSIIEKVGLHKQKTQQEDVK